MWHIGETLGPGDYEDLIQNKEEIVNGQRPKDKTFFNIKSPMFNAYIRKKYHIKVVDISKYFD